MKERKIGETFEFEGKKIKVKEAVCCECDGCILDGKCTRDNRSITGHCEGIERDDNTEVIFVEVQEQPQDEQPKLNLCEILKYCPQGEQFWSPMMGDVELHKINHEAKRICVIEKKGSQWWINADATMTFGGITSVEVMLYPSREQRDWTKVKYEPKKELPKTWEEFCKNYPIGKAEYFLNSSCRLRETRSGAERQEVLDRNILPSKQAAEAHLALMQLHQLRDAWREGWLPDWDDYNQGKYAITKLRSEYEVYEYKVSSFFLSFQDEKRADEFKDCFIGLIEKAGDLI